MNNSYSRMNLQLDHKRYATNYLREFHSPCNTANLKEFCKKLRDSPFCFEQTISMTAIKAELGSGLRFAGVLQMCKKLKTRTGNRLKQLLSATFMLLVSGSSKGGGGGGCSAPLQSAHNIFHQFSDMILQVHAAPIIDLYGPHIRFPQKNSWGCH